MSKEIFSPEGVKKEIEPRVKEIKLKEGGICTECKKDKKGKFFKVITQADINRLKKEYPEEFKDLSQEEIMQEMCEDCMEKKIVEDK
jgi:hypothetical protein